MQNSIQTDRLVLRSFEERDFEDFREFYADPEASFFMGGFPDLSPRGIKAEFMGCCINPLVMAIYSKSLRKVMGSIHFSHVVCGYLANVGYMIGQKHRGKGYGKEALGAFTEWGFQKQGYGKIRGITLIANTASQRLLESCGFQKEALLYEWDYGGRVENVLIYALENRGEV